MKMISFAWFWFLWMTINSFNPIVAKEKDLDHKLGEKICHSFGEKKCPFDDYCFKGDDIAIYDNACKFCPSGGEKDICDESWFAKDGKGFYEKCPNTEKYYSKRYFACTWRDNCPSTSNNINLTRFDEGCTIENCGEKTRNERLFKCPNDKKCVKDENECDPCTSKNGGNEGLCTEEYCNKLNLTETDREEFGDDHYYVRCKQSDKCILKAQLCNGYKDCPNNEDEIDCLKEDCQQLGKIKCPFEDKCIEESFACSDDFVTKYPRNRCKYNLNCIEKCLEQEETRFFCPLSNPSTTKGLWMNYNCPQVNQICNNPDLGLMKSLNLTHKLWRCSSERYQYIPTDKVCDGIYDCLMNEDESENTCKSFPLSMAIAYSSAIVSGIITIMICLKSFAHITHKFMCFQCLDKYTFYLGDQEWIKKRRLLTMLIGEESKELVTSNNYNEFMASTFQDEKQAENLSVCLDKTNAG